MPNVLCILSAKITSGCNNLLITNSAIQHFNMVFLTGEKNCCMPVEMHKLMPPPSGSATDDMSLAFRR